LNHRRHEEQSGNRKQSRKWSQKDKIENGKKMDVKDEDTNQHEFEQREMSSNYKEAEAEAEREN